MEERQSRQPTYEELLALVAELRERIKVLEAELAEARQAAARQAAPFRRREQLKKPEGQKKRPGREPGHEGQFRPAPAVVHESTKCRTCRALKTLCGLQLSPGGLSQLLQRAARRTGDWFAEIQQQIRTSAAVFADETSWYVGRPGWWLWVFTTPTATLYQVREGRGSNVVREVLGDDFAGILVSDCLASYNPLACRKHKCLAHHLRALKEQEEALTKRGVASLYLALWKLQLKDVIATWRTRGELSAEAYAAKVEQLRRGIESLLDQSPSEPEENRFRDRLRRQRPYLVGCLDDPAAEPTNNRAERDLRPAVMQRKTSCGNKTQRGKTAWEQLRSIVATAAHEGRDLLATLANRLRLAPT